MDQNILRLIKFVNDNYEHIGDLERLINLISRATEDTVGTCHELIIAKTTHNSHYDYKLYTYPEFQNPENHVDKHVVPETMQSL